MQILFAGATVHHDLALIPPCSSPLGLLETKAIRLIFPQASGRLKYARIIPSRTVLAVTAAHWVATAGPVGFLCSVRHVNWLATHFSRSLAPKALRPSKLKHYENT